MFGPQLNPANMRHASAGPHPSEQFSMERWLANANPSRTAPRAQTCTSSLPLTLARLPRTNINGQQRTSYSTPQWLATPSPANTFKLAPPSRKPTPCKHAQPHLGTHACLPQSRAANHRGTRYLSLPSYLRTRPSGQRQKKSGRAASFCLLIKSANADDILRRWEMAKLIVMLPEQDLCKLAGLNAPDFKSREPASYILDKAGAVTVDSIHKERHTLTRMLSYM